MSPSMPLNITIPAAASTSRASSAASSPTGSSSSSSSKSGVYVPVHKRIRSAEVAVRTLPIYTPAELLQLAQSPLVRRASGTTHAALHAREDLAAIALSRRQQRSREYLQQQRNNERVGESKENKPSTVVVVALRRRTVGRAAERMGGSNNNNSRRNVAASKFMDAASWRGQQQQSIATRHTVEALPVSLAV